MCPDLMATYIINRVPQYDYHARKLGTYEKMLLIMNKDFKNK